jgi:hypothetical protein
MSFNIFQGTQGYEISHLWFLITKVHFEQKRPVRRPMCTGELISLKWELPLGKYTRHYVSPRKVSVGGQSAEGRGHTSTAAFTDLNIVVPLTCLSEI